MTKAIPYIPCSLTSVEVRRSAFRCGRELAPDDERAMWIDELSGELFLDAIVAYHEGQAQQFEEEMW